MGKRRTPDEPEGRPPRKRAPRQPRKSTTPRAKMVPSPPDPPSASISKPVALPLPEPLSADAIIAQQRVDTATQERQVIRSPLCGKPSLLRRAAGIKEITGWVHPAAVLVGLGAGWEWCGLHALVASSLDPSVATTVMLAAVALLAAAAGPRMPSRLVLGIATKLRGRNPHASTPSADAINESFWILRAARTRDEPLLWLSVAVLASAAGAAGILSLLLTAVFNQTYHALVASFFWTRFTLTTLEWAGVTLATGILWLMNGILVAALAPIVTMDNRPRHLPGSIITGLPMGLGLAWLLHSSWLAAHLSAVQEVLLGTLPFFTLSAIGAWKSHQQEHAEQLGTVTREQEPELTGRAEGWIRLSLMVWGVTFTLICSGWHVCRHIASAWPGDHARPGVLMVGLAIGSLVASLHAARRRQSPAGCGMALWGAGIAAAGAAVLIAHHPTGSLAGLLQVIAICLPAGYALHYVGRAWFIRASSESLGFTQLVTTVLASIAVGLISAWYLILPALGPIGLITTGSLMLLALGGLVQIYEESGSPHTRHLRLAMVFASLALTMILFPASANIWSQTVAAHHDARSILLPPGNEGSFRRQRACVIVSSSPVDIIPSQGFQGQIDLFLLHPMWRDGPRGFSDGLVRLLPGSAFRQLRMEPVRYDLVYQSGPYLKPGLTCEAYSVEWMSLMASRTSLGGRIAVDVPLAGATIESIKLVAHTFERAVGPAAKWWAIEDNGAPVLRIVAVPGSASSYHPDNAGGTPLSRLYGPGGPPDFVHSLRRDRLSSALKSRSPTAVASLAAELRHIESNISTAPSQQ